MWFFFSHSTKGSAIMHKAGKPCTQDILTPLSNRVIKISVLSSVFLNSLFPVPFQHGKPQPASHSAEGAAAKRILLLASGLRQDLIRTAAMRQC